MRRYVPMTVTTSIFGHTKQGETVTAYRVENRTGMQLTVLEQISFWGGVRVM